jgi:hypothetical protein
LFPLVFLASIYTEVVKVFSSSLLNTLRASGLTYLRAVFLFRAVFYKGPVVDSCLEDSLVSPVRLRDPLFRLKSGREAASGGCGQHWSLELSVREITVQRRSVPRTRKTAPEKPGIGAEFEPRPIKRHGSRTWPRGPLDLSWSGSIAQWETEPVPLKPNSGRPNLDPSILWIDLAQSAASLCHLSPWCAILSLGARILFHLH